MSKQKVVVAMSGGVDSSVAALLLKKSGYDVIGITMRLWTAHNPDPIARKRGCCSVEDVDDARRVCSLINAPHYYQNFEQQFKTHVIDYFVKEYKLGRTPYPCLACNDYLKFRFLLDRAKFLGADFIATGHYARIDTSREQYSLLQSVDAHKDQSYALFGLTQKQLRNILLPIGWLKKEEIRTIAKKALLPVADKPDSQEICFIPNGDYREFLSENGASPHSGDVVDASGIVIGKHNGIEHFTIGQRKGLGIAAKKPMYVTALDAQTNRVIVGCDSDLYEQKLFAENVNWISGETPKSTIEATAKIRYNSVQAKAKITPTQGGVYIHFEQPQRAISPGQPAVFYAGEQVLGGGIITHKKI